MSYRAEMQSRADAFMFPINLTSDRSVVTRDGEYLGTWGTDESDAIFEFTPDGSAGVLLRDPFIGLLCDQIADWLSSRHAPD